MLFARVFAPSRVWKPLVALCALCALAFTLGQGAAAVQMKLAQALTPAAAASARQINLPVAGAQGTTPTPNVSSSTTRSAPASPVSYVEKKAPAPNAAPESQKPRPVTADAGPKEKGKRHTKHLKAAGDDSHGGLHHGGNPKAGNARGGQKDQ